MCFKNAAVIISTSSIYTSLSFSLPTTIFILYIFLISQTLVYPCSNFIIILGNTFGLLMDPYFFILPALLHGFYFLSFNSYFQRQYQNGPSHLSLVRAFYIRPRHGLLPGLWIICPWVGFLSICNEIIWYNIWLFRMVL